MRSRTAVVVSLFAALPVAAPALAEDPPKLGWSDTAEFSYVQTAGNSESSTLGLNNRLARRWENALFAFKLGAIRAESTTFERSAIGTIDDYYVDEQATSALTAENYYLNAQYDRKISDRLVWNAGAGWDRNTFAGIENRYAVFAGLGNVWINKETVKFKTDYSVTYTQRDEVVDDPSREENFAGFRFAWDYLNKFGDATTFTNTLVLDDNLQEMSDWRGDTTFAVAVAMSKTLALKASLRFLYANEPAKEELALVPGTEENPTVLVPLEKLDTIFTTSLVVAW
jgi:putative salt-induced outer membrane protein YdiY